VRVPVVNIDGLTRCGNSIHKAVLRRHSVNLSFNNIAFPRAAVVCRKESNLSILTGEHLTISNLSHATIHSLSVKPVGNGDGGRIRDVVISHFQYLARNTKAFDTYSVEARIDLCSPTGTLIGQL